MVITFKRPGERESPKLAKLRSPRSEWGEGLKRAGKARSGVAQPILPLSMSSLTQPVQPGHISEQDRLNEDDRAGANTEKGGRSDLE